MTWSRSTTIYWANAPNSVSFVPPQTVKLKVCSETDTHEGSKASRTHLPSGASGSRSQPRIGRKKTRLESKASCLSADATTTPETCSMFNYMQVHKVAIWTHTCSICAHDVSKPNPGIQALPYPELAYVVSQQLQRHSSRMRPLTSRWLNPAACTRTRICPVLSCGMGRSSTTASWKTGFVAWAALRTTRARVVLGIWTAEAMIVPRVIGRQHRASKKADYN